jgi:5-methyltetrahydropteroyltriglutamate--homocysteine methyltransferase
VVNPRTPDVESPDEVVARVREALKDLPAERVFLNPDCGFATFSNRAMNSEEIAEEKLKTMVSAATSLRG